MAKLHAKSYVWFYFTDLTSMVLFVLQVYSYVERVENGSATFELNFYMYSNPGQIKSNGQSCDSPADYCDILLDVCISKQGEK